MYKGDSIREVLEDVYKDRRRQLRRLHDCMPHEMDCQVECIERMIRVHEKQGRAIYMDHAAAEDELTIKEPDEGAHARADHLFSLTRKVFVPYGLEGNRFCFRLTMDERRVHYNSGFDTRLRVFEAEPNGELMITRKFGGRDQYDIGVIHADIDFWAEREKLKAGIDVFASTLPFRHRALAPMASPA